MSQGGSKAERLLLEACAPAGSEPPGFWTGNAAFVRLQLYQDDVGADAADAVPGNDILAGRTPETEAKAPGSRNHNSRNTPAFAVKLHIHRAAQSTAGTDIDHFFLF